MRHHLRFHALKAFGDSAMERLKQEILGQELVFRNQVRELHRVYWTQKNLMNELRLSGVNALASKGKNAFSDPSQDRKGGNALDRNVPALLNSHQRILNLQLPADDFIILVEHGKETNHDSETEHSKSNGNFEIGYGIGEVIVEKGLRALGSFRCNEIIDLEDSMDVECHEAHEILCGSFSTVVRRGSGLFGSQPIVPIEGASSSLTGNNMYCLPSMVQLGEGQDRRLQKQKLHVSSVGHGDSGVATVSNLSSKSHGSRPELIGLNVPHEDKCFHDQNLHFVKIASPSMNSSIDHHGILEVQPTKRFPEKISFASKPDSANPVSKTSCEKRTEWLFHLNQDSQPCRRLQDSTLAGNNANDIINNVNEVVIAGLASAYEVPIVCGKNSGERFTGSGCRDCVSIKGASILPMDVCEQGKENSDSQPGELQCKELSDNKRQDSNITSVSSVNQSQTVSRDSDKPSNCKEDTLSSHSTAQDDDQPNELNKKFSAEYNSNGLSSNSDCSSDEKSVGEPATLSITDDSMITQSNSPKHEISYIRKPKLEGRDVAIAAAAEALMTISFGRSAIAAEQLDKMEAVQVLCVDRSDGPQRSSDSFEFMAMHLSEVQNNEHIVMPEMPSLNETRKDERRIQLRRGSRLRDFRKEILPGLVSLSRHEIWEDLYNIGYKLRKNAPKSVRGSWFVPVQNRRSRLRLAHRRL